MIGKLLPIQFGKAARKYFEHLDQTTQERMKKKLRAIALDPFNVVNSKPLVSSVKRSARVGGYRILFIVTADEIVITDIDARGDVYK